MNRGDEEVAEARDTSVDDVGKEALACEVWRRSPRRTEGADGTLEWGEVCGCNSGDDETEAGRLAAWLVGTCSAGLGERIGGGLVPAAGRMEMCHYDVRRINSSSYASGRQRVPEKAQEASLSLGFRTGRYGFCI